MATHRHVRQLWYPCFAWWPVRGYNYAQGVRGARGKVWLWGWVYRKLCSYGVGNYEWLYCKLPEEQ